MTTWLSFPWGLQVELYAWSMAKALSKVYLHGGQCALLRHLKQKVTSPSCEAYWDDKGRITGVQENCWGQDGC